MIADEFASPDLELAWLDEDTGAAQAEAQLEARVKIGAATLNELRDALGLEPFQNPAADRPMVLTATGYVPIEANAGGEGSASPTGGKGQGANAQAAPAVQKYNPDQPRVPAGQSGGGQWTSEGGSGSSPESMAPPVAEEHPSSGRGTQYAALETNVVSDAGDGAPHSPTPQDSTEPRIQVAGNDWRNLPVNLAEDEAPNGPGHAISKHVAKTEAELRAEFPPDIRFGFGGGLIRKRNGSFDSIENANDLTNRTLRANSEQVDRVANGQEADDFIEYRFGFVTGYELYRPDPDSRQLEMRRTYSVGVFIVHDPRSPRGFRVITAFPKNSD